VKSSILSWLSNNWFGVLALITGVWVSLALRLRPRIRFWTIGDRFGGTYFRPGSTHTALYIRNVGNQPVDSNQWRSPLSIECQTDISTANVAGVSREDITVSVQRVEGDQKRIVLSISRLDPGDELAVEMQHDRTLRAPQLKGELLGARDTLARGMTMSQRFSGLLFAATIIPIDYTELSSIAWLTYSRLTVGGVAQGAVFLLASTFLPLLTWPMLRRNVLRDRPMQALGIFYTLFIVITIMRTASFSIAFVNGYRLWYPAFLIYVIATMIVVRMAGVQAASATLGLAELESRSSPAIAGFTSALGPTVFAAFVISGSSPSVLVLVGLACILSVAIVRLDRQQVRQRLSAAVGNPRTRTTLYPPRKAELPYVPDGNESQGEDSPGPPGPVDT